MKYLENRKSKLRSVFIFDILVSRSLKLDLMLIDFEVFFFRTSNTVCTHGVYLSVLMLSLISTSIFNIFDTSFSLLRNCTCLCVLFYRCLFCVRYFSHARGYTSTPVLTRVRDCTFVPVLARVRDYTSVLVLTHVCDCTYVRVLARARDCTSVLVLARVRDYTSVTSTS
jgi:hypothetical protein